MKGSTQVVHKDQDKSQERMGIRGGQKQCLRKGMPREEMEMR